MPIKLPKAFPRRKSSGHVLEEVENPPEPSFRVFERPDHKSFDGGNSLKRMSLGRPLSAGYPSQEDIYRARPNSNPNNRGSGGTNNSASSGHDTSSASARFSSSSTLPSSTDMPLDDGPDLHPKTSDNIPIPPTPSSNPLSFRTGARTFSFGRKKAQTSSNMPPPPQHVSESPGFKNVGRERALTESSYASGSTATPPKLLDSGLDFGNSDLDSFGRMFDNVGKRTSQTEGNQLGLVAPRTESPENISPGGSRMLTKPNNDHFANTPSPTQIDRSRALNFSPYSQNSNDSQDGLMNSVSPAVASPMYYEDIPPTPKHVQPMPNNMSPSSRPQQAGPRPVTGLRRSSPQVRRDSVPLQDEDAKLVMDSVRASQRLNRQSRDFDSYIDSYRDSYRENDEGFESQPTASWARSPISPNQPVGKERQRTPVEIYDVSVRDERNGRWRQDSAETTPRAKKLDMAQPEEERSLFDKSPPHPERSAPPPRKPVPPANAGSNKVMTPAEFERYRKEQENLRSQWKDDDSDEGSENDEDEDEEERKKQLARERRKQEAHLAVYRQQMMKVTGQQPSDLPSLRPGLEKSQTAPAGRAVTPTFTFDRPSDGSKASDDEDDEVPLGILAAHGFPAKNRPPTASIAPSIKYQSESYPPPPLSSAGASTAGNRTTGLPPFAKNLPPDPYFGAGLVNPSARESLGFNQSSASSAYGGSQAANHHTNHPSHPSGLVGVIAGEERARAARRGSPHAQGGFGSPLPQGMMPPTMGMPPPLTPGDEAQIQMSQQMTQMMQMQMQWMQQMQAMMAQGMQPPPMPGPGQMQMPMPMPGQPPLPPQHRAPSGFLSPQPQMGGSGLLSPGHVPRPVSHSAPSTPSAVQTSPRAMSMMTATAPAQWSQMQRQSHLPPGAQQGYAPSIAPSERSNVGQPSRYRPVSIPAIQEGSRPGSSASGSAAGKLKITGGGVRKVAKGSDDDDEEGWEEMKRKREQRMSERKGKKDSQNGLEGFYFPTE